jgi:hypothetical protein
VKQSRVPRRRWALAAATLSLVILPVSGCDNAEQTLSSADACADLIGMSLKELRDAQQHVDSPEEVARQLRQAAQTFEAKANTIDDQDVQRAVDDYVARLRALAQQIRAGNPPDLDLVVRANKALANACA